MAPSEVRRPTHGRGIRVGCVDHDEWTELPVGQAGGALACERCALELSVRLRDLTDWRDWGERCEGPRPPEY